MRLAALLLLPFSLCAQTHGLEVRPVSDELPSQEPRQTVTMALQVRNNTGRAGQFEARLLLPPGWQLVTPQFPFELKEGEAAVRFLSFFIPAGAASGDYRVTYEVNDRQRPEIRAAYALPVRVLPVMKLQALALDSPDFVIAGQPYEAVFAARNGGNAPVTVDYQFKSSLGSPLEPASGSLNIKPGESQRLPVAAKTGLFSRPERDILTLEIRVRGSAALDVASSAIKVLPQVSGSVQRYNTIPVVLRLRGMMRDEGLNRDFGWQAEAAGGGTIDEAGKRHVEFFLRGPDVQDQAIFGTYDEYRGRYWDENTALTLGDWTYALSPLTENGRYGRGGRAAYHGERWSVEAYYMADRFSRAQDLIETNPLLDFVDPLNRPRIRTEPMQQTAIAASYLITPGLRLSANYLGKDTGVRADIASLRGQLVLDPGFELDLEMARNQGENRNDYAFRGYMLDERHPFRYQGTLIHAGPDFNGYYRDEQLGFLSADYPFSERLRFRGAVNIQRNNLSRDPARVANDQRQILLGSDYQWFKDTRVSAEYRFRSQKDRRPVPDFDATHHGVGAKLGQRIKAVSVYGGGEWGITQDHRAGQKPFQTQFAYGTASWPATERQSYSAYAFHDNSTYSATRQSSQTSLGVNADYRVGQSSTFSLNVMKNLGARQGSYLFNGRLTHQLDNGHQIWLDARHNTGATSRTDVMLTYSVPFGLPVSRKPGVAEFSGRVYDQFSGQGVPDIILNMGGLIAVTDDDGAFSFPSVKTGPQHLVMENAGSAWGKVPAQAVPPDIEVRSDSAANHLEVAMIQGARLSGRVVVYEDANEALSSQNYVTDGNDKRPRKLKPSHGLQNVLVVMRSADKTYKRLTDAEGAVGIAQLPPGIWRIEVMADDLPTNFVQERKHFEVKLEPGATCSFEYKIIPKIRKIKMLPPLGSSRLSLAAGSAVKTNLGMETK
jgi:hypothetical protein